MIHAIKYNSQRDNISLGGFRAYWQCFSTSAWMFMSFYSPDIDATNDTKLSIYLDDVEDSIGNPGIGEIVKRKYNWITGRTSFWWLVQKEGIEKWLWHVGIKGVVFFSDKQTDFDNLRKLVDNGPVILQTNKLGGLKGGHIILAVGYTDNALICHDPYGNCMTNYKDHNGAYVAYPDEVLMKATGEKIRCLYWKNI
jgi:hypothetical protein